VLHQTRPPLEVIVAVDGSPALLRRVEAELPEVRAVLNTGVGGASGARNAGAAVARGDVLAFLDDDTRASRTWLADLVSALVEVPGTVGVGGGVGGDWPGGAAPRWFPPEFLWAVGVSHEGMPGSRSRVRNVWSENMALWRSAFVGAGGFRDGFGKVGSSSRPEDTELCIRVARGTGRSWVFVPDAQVVHAVPWTRTTWGFFVRRCWAEGRGKAEMAALSEDGALTSERDHVLVAIPRGVIRDVGAALTGDLWGLTRAATAAAGVLAAAGGYLAGRVARPFTQPC
jgi:glycosyltransferase involved in cell wall biosynthesis